MILLALLAIRLLPGALRQQARALELITLLFQLTAASGAPNTSKTYAAEARTASLETRVGTLEQGQFANLQSSSVIGTLQRGIFTNVSGGSTISMETQQGSVTLHCGALSNFTSGPQAAFLASMNKGQSPGGVATDPNSGGSWANNERADYINDLRGKWNALLGTLINNNHINAA